MSFFISFFTSICPVVCAGFLRFVYAQRKSTTERMYSFYGTRDVLYTFGGEGEDVLQVVWGYRLMPLGVGMPRPRRALARRGRKIPISKEGHEEDLKDDEPRMMVARPRAVPIPLPLIALTPVRLNLCERKWKLVRIKSVWQSRG